MKKLLFILATLFVVNAANAQEDNMESLWDKANTAYVNNEFSQAIAYYDSILMGGQVSPKLYYNLGNAYFKNGQIGKSILNYVRAQDLAPTDQDIRYNLRVANGYVKDNIESVPEFFLATWFRSLRMSLSSNSWAVISIFVFVVFLAAVLLYLLGNMIVLRKAGFYTAIVGLLLFIMTVSFSAMERRQMLYPDEAVVLDGSTVVRSSPDNNSKELFIIHEGTKVKIIRGMSGWHEIMIADGKKGWVNGGSVETI